LYVLNSGCIKTVLINEFGNEQVPSMTRQEIGSYLGPTLETISRTLSAFNEIGLITVDQRTICIKDAEALQTLRRLSPRARANNSSGETIRTGECLQQRYTGHGWHRR
jgi:hypothetical protein